MYNVVVKNNYSSNKLSKTKLSKYITILALILVLIFIAITSQGSKPIKYRNITIEKGDTLWSIVKSYQSNEIDPRKMINQIKRINDLKTAVLQPGQTIKIPSF